MALPLFCMILVVALSNAQLYSSSGPKFHRSSSVIHDGQASVHHGTPLVHQGSSRVINKASTTNFYDHEDNIVDSTIYRDDVVNVSPATSKSIINEVSHHEPFSINSVTHHVPIDLALHGHDQEHSVSYRDPAITVAHHEQSQGHSVSYHDPAISVAHHGAALPVNHHAPAVSVNHYVTPLPVHHHAPTISVNHHIPAVSINHATSVSIEHHGPPVSVNHHAPPLPVRYSPNNVIISNVKSSPSYPVHNALHPIPVVADYPEPIGAPEVPANVFPVTTFVQDVPIAEVGAYAHGTPVGFVRSQYHSQDELGRYSFGYNTGNSAREETRDANGHVRGSYSYVDANGETQSRYYTADDRGFQVHGTDLPVGPVGQGH